MNGIYQISNFGNVKNIKKNKLLKPAINKDGYYTLLLSKNGVQKSFKVHKLVASHFLKEPIIQVNHKNGNKLDNKVQNLEWCNCKDNIHHALKNNLMKPAKGKEHYMAKEVGKYNENNQLIEKYDTIVQAGKLNKISDTNIIHCLKGRTKTAGGYKWKYMD